MPYRNERTEPRVEIYTGKGKDKRLITSIELLSPTNKTPGQHGRELFSAVACEELLASDPTEQASRHLAQHDRR